MQPEVTRLILRLPHEQKRWVEEWAAGNWTSMNAEIIRSIRDRHERERAEQAAA